jgi:mannose-1-phosphate guanylyltransferase
MKAMVLAAGRGTRLWPLTADCPKPMLPIGGKPLLEHTLVLLRQHQVTEVVINLHHGSDAITGYFGDGSRWGMCITYSHEEQLLGTAGAVRKVADLFDETFLVIYGDVFTHANLTMLTRFHKERGASVTIGLYRVSNPTQCGLVGLDASARVTRFIEKPPPELVFTDLANAGVYAIEPEVLDYLPEQPPLDFGHDVFPRLLEAGMYLFGYLMSDYLIDIGTLEKYETAQRDWQAGRVK